MTSRGKAATSDATPSLALARPAFTVGLTAARRPACGNEGVIDMAELFRPTYSYKDPVTGKRVNARSKTWHVRYYDAAGVRHRQKGYKDKKATEALAVRLERRSARLAEGLADPLDELIRTPLAVHLDAYSKYLADKGNVPRHVQLTRARIA